MWIAIFSTKMNTKQQLNTDEVYQNTSLTENEASLPIFTGWMPLVDGHAQVLANDSTVDTTVLKYCTVSVLPHVLEENIFAQSTYPPTEENVKISFRGSYQPFVSSKKKVISYQYRVFSSPWQILQQKRDQLSREPFKLIMQMYFKRAKLPQNTLTTPVFPVCQFWVMNIFF